MAKLEDGFTRIPHKILEALCGIKFSLYEFKTILYIIRKTYGWGKRDDWISYSQFEKATHMDRRHVGTALRQLEDRNIIEISGEARKPKYKVQGDVTKWQHDVKGRAHSPVTPRGNGHKHCLEGDVLLPLQVTDSLPLGATTIDNDKRKRQEKVFSSSKETTEISVEVRATLDELQKLRGWETPRWDEEAEDIDWMLNHKCTRSDILGCYVAMKKLPFWQDKALYMSSVKKEVGNYRRRTRQLGTVIEGGMGRFVVRN
jgi:phage replication O-like protein O